MTAAVIDLSARRQALPPRERPAPQDLAPVIQYRRPPIGVGGALRPHFNCRCSVTYIRPPVSTWPVSVGLYMAAAWVATVSVSVWAALWLGGLW